MSISGALQFPTSVPPEGPVAPFGAAGRSGAAQPAGSARFTTQSTDQPQVPAEERDQQQAPLQPPQSLVNPANLSQAQESGGSSRTAAGTGQQAQAGETGEEQPRTSADPAPLREARQGEDGESEELTPGLDGEEETTDIAARLVPVRNAEGADAVAVDGRPDAVRAGDLASAPQRPASAPLEVPNYAIDPDERSIQIFNERLNRTTEVLQFLSQRPNVGAARGVSIIV